MCRQRIAKYLFAVRIEIHQLPMGQNVGHANDNRIRVTNRQGRRRSMDSTQHRLHKPRHAPGRDRRGYRKKKQASRLDETIMLKGAVVSS